MMSQAKIPAQRGGSSQEIPPVAEEFSQVMAVGSGRVSFLQQTSETSQIAIDGPATMLIQVALRDLTGLTMKLGSGQTRRGERMGKCRLDQNILHAYMEFLNNFKRINLLYFKENA